MLRTAKAKIRKSLRAGISAWWVLLIIAVYTVLAGQFLGTACLLASTTGLPCPGCGMTRAALALLHGDVAGSLSFHPLLIPSALVLTVYFVTWLTRERVPRQAGVMLAALMVLMAITYALRMVLMFPRVAPMRLNYSSVLLRFVTWVRTLFA